MHLASIHIHPIKSCAGVAVEAVDIGPLGPAGDRRYMLVDGEGRFVTGREHGRLVRMAPLLSADGLEVRALDEPDAPSLRVPAPADDAPRVEVVVWKDRLAAQHVSDAADAWFSARLGMPVRLVHMDARARRPLVRDGAQDGDAVSFADAWPVLLVSDAASGALSERAGRALSMRRFRPNLTVAGCAPHAEDGWRRLRIGGVEFEAPEPCTRCVFTTVDPETGERDAAGEPLATLKGYRRGPRGITFGLNLVPRGSGRIAVGDPVEVLA